MTLIERVKKICLTPAAEWPVIAGEETPAGELVTQYVLPLAAASAVAAFIGTSIVGVTAPFVGTFRVPIVSGLVMTVVRVVVAVAAVYIMGAVVSALAPTFGARKDPDQAFKLMAYAITPAWVAGLLQIIPALGALALLGALYCIYLIYLGLPDLMQAPREKAIGYTAAVVVAGIVVAVVLGGLTALVTGVAGIGAGGAGFVLG